MQSNKLFDYKPLLQEVYIDPIRTVTVIDDEYPTLEKLVDPNHSDYFDESKKERVKSLIEFSRKQTKPWMVNIYDGKESGDVAESLSKKLHHSDLLILDYHLDGNGSEDTRCQKTLNIISNLASNRHFNIVIIHTKGYEGDIKNVLLDIIVSLQKYPVHMELQSKQSERIGNAIDEWILEDDSIEARLLSSISKLELLFFINRNKTFDVSKDRENPYMRQLASIYDEKPEEVNMNWKQLIEWLFDSMFSGFKGENLFADKTAKHFEWGISQDESSNWIRAEDLFLTVVEKNNDDFDYLNKRLVQALNNWKPHPHKLILNKLRNEISSKGIYAAGNILSNEHLHAEWLKTTVKGVNEATQAKSNAWSTVAKLWESLASEIKPDIDEFTSKLFKELSLIENPLEAFLKGEPLDNTRSIEEANCFSCSRKITAHHLITGHILYFLNDYWLCLTPMCDLVPEQKYSNSELMPVTLVRLYKAKDALWLTLNSLKDKFGLDWINDSKPNETKIKKLIIEHSTTNNLLFIKPENIPDKTEIEILSFTKGIDGTATPMVSTYYARNQGTFVENTVKLSKFDIKNGEVQTNITATVTAELRYEYALNLLFKLGYSLSRVGLNFVR